MFCLFVASATANVRIPKNFDRENGEMEKTLNLYSHSRDQKIADVSSTISSIVQVFSNNTIFVFLNEMMTK